MAFEKNASSILWMVFFSKVELPDVLVCAAYCGLNPIAFTSLPYLACSLRISCAKYSGDS